LPHWEETSFVDGLIDDFVSNGAWRDHWKILDHDSSGISVTNGPLKLTTSKSELSAQAVRTGEPCRVRFPSCLRYALPGWCSFVGDAGSHDAGSKLLRVYLAAGDGKRAAKVVGGLSAALNSQKIRFSLKIANHSSRLDRADAMVLYIDGDSWLRVRPDVISAYREGSWRLDQRPPGFTKLVAPGVGMAEELAKSSQISFGQHLAAVIANALLTEPEHSSSKVTRLKYLRRALSEAGLDPTHPFKSPATDLKFFEEWDV
jgi:hypothetical protein